MVFLLCFVCGQTSPVQYALSNYIHLHGCDVMLQCSLFPSEEKMQCRFYDLANNIVAPARLCSFTSTQCGESMMTAEARGQEGLLTMVSSNIDILCQDLQMVRVCDTDQLSLLILVSDTKEHQHKSCLTVD